MVAERHTEPASLPLLYEPDEPAPKTGRCGPGWRHRRLSDDGRTWARGGFVRVYRDDAHGAQIQHAIVRYVLGGASRSAVAREISVSERQMQAYLGAEQWAAYAQPVLRALKRLGISEGRGQWWGPPTRAHEVIQASQATMRLAIRALDGDATADETAQLLSDLRLLTVVEHCPRAIHAVIRSVEAVP